MDNQSIPYTIMAFTFNGHEIQFDGQQGYLASQMFGNAVNQASPEQVLQRQLEQYNCWIRGGCCPCCVSLKYVNCCPVPAAPQTCTMPVKVCIKCSDWPAVLQIGGGFFAALFGLLDDILITTPTWLFHGCPGCPGKPQCCTYIWPNDIKNAMNA
jgi:hypothetical protein